MQERIYETWQLNACSKAAIIKMKHNHLQSHLLMFFSGFRFNAVEEKIDAVIGSLGVSALTLSWFPEFHCAISSTD